MKKLISIALSILMVLSLVFVVYASGNTDKGNGKIRETVEGTPSPEVTPAVTPADTLEGLTEQLKANHKDKGLRKMLHSKIKEMRKLAGDTTIPILVNGQLVESDVPPVIKNYRTLIPVRAVSNALGANVEWDGDELVTITKAVDTSVTEAVYTTVVINLRTREITKDGVAMVLDVKPQVISNRTFVPIRFIAEAFGMKVDWDEDLDGVVVDDDDEATPSPTPITTPEPTATPTATVEPTPTPTPIT